MSNIFIDSLFYFLHVMIIPMCELTIVWCSSKWIFQIIFLCKVFLTIAVMIWFLPSVFSQLNYTVITMWESLLTMATLIWFLIRVCPHMNCKLTILWENIVIIVLIIFKIIILWERCGILTGLILSLPFVRVLFYGNYI